MLASPIPPLADIPVDPVVAELPKADLHLHQVATARLERLAARHRGRAPYDWRGWARRVMAERPPGLNRLAAVSEPDATLDLDGVRPANPDSFVARVAAVLAEAAADSAVLAEDRFGPTAAPPAAPRSAPERPPTRAGHPRHPLNGAARGPPVGYRRPTGTPGRCARGDDRSPPGLEVGAGVT